MIASGGLNKLNRPSSVSYTHLGYSERDVADIVESLDDGKRDVSELIKVSLIELGKGR